MTTWRQSAVNILVVLLSAGTLFAQNFWDRKDYLQWTSEEVTKLTSDSPWVKKLNELSITWLTALPVKQALLKERMDAGGVLADSAKEIMSVEEKYYAIGISGLSPDMAKKLTEAALRFPGKPQIDPANANFQSRGRTIDVMILFPRMNPITVDDKEVEVILKMDGVEIGKKFPLMDMMYKGKLEL